MTGENLLMGLSYINRKFVEESEQDAVITKSGAYAKQKQGRNLLRKPLLIAAILALLLFLMGCAWALLRMQDLKIGEHTVTQTQYDGQGNPAGETVTQLEVLSLQGIMDTPNYLANQEWLAFTQSYTPTGGEYWESDEAYWAYSVLNQEMVDKLDEICAKYGLKVIGKPWHEHKDCSVFLSLAGIDSLLKTDSEAVLCLPQGRFFPGGSFNVYGTLTLPGREQTVSLSFGCMKKDVFYDVFAYVDSDTVTQRNYTTAEGVCLLLLESDGSGMILADREDCFINISVSAYNGSTLEEIADQFDFEIRATPLDAAAAEAREQASLAELGDNGMDPNFLRRETYREYVEDLLWSDSQKIMNGWDASDISDKEYALYDLDGNGEQELLIFYDGYIGSVVGMKDGRTDEGKSYHMKLYEGNVLIETAEMKSGPFAGITYHIFTFANNGDPVFSNPKERSIVRLWKDAQGIWRRTSSTDHYADYDTQITEAEAMEILNSYKPVQLDTRPLTEYEEPQA